MGEPRPRLRVAVLFGGESAEHEVSLQSALNVVQAMDPEKYEILLIGVDKRGRWHLADSARFLLDAADPQRIRLAEGGGSLGLLPGRDSEKLVSMGGGARPPVVAEGLPEGTLDVVFPVLHGPMGEDGSVQGLLQLAHLPCVGSGILGSAIGMDKEVAKRLLLQAGVPVPRFVTLRRGTRAPAGFDDLAERLGLPFFLKPANMGSSVGVHKVHARGEFEEALEDAFSFDRKVLAEEFIDGRELECAVLGNEEPIASVPGEVVPLHEFYSYEAKYLDEEGARLEIPARLSAATVGLVQELALQTFRVLECEGMARVDFFLRESGDLLVNEVNTIPGFTRISMYPKLWEASGIGYPELIDRLLRLALERAERDRDRRSSVELVPDEAD